MHKRNYKTKVPSQILEPNDTVLLRNVSEKERAGKVTTYCEKDIYPLVLNRKEEKQTEVILTTTYSYKHET